MEYSKTGEQLTKQSEGCKLTAYQDIRGIWTIGVGHTGADVYEGLIITQEQADAFLLADTQNAVNHINALVKVPLTQSEFDALVDFAYNAGCGAFAKSTMLRLLNEGDYQGAAAQFDDWDFAGGKVVSGLLRRRQAETQEFQG